MLPQRTLKAAVDLSAMRTISSDDLLAMDRDSYHAVRRAAAQARHDGVPRFVCQLCGHPVYAPRAPHTRQPLWRHHRGASPLCEWWSGDPSTIDQISARQFDGARESPLHSRLKLLVAEALERDPDTEAGSVVVDRYLVTGEGRRRPDVRATHGGRPIAVEVQLASTQIPIIVARESFYEREGRALLWLTWCFDTGATMSTAFEDIFYSHNRNLFSLDPEVVERSERDGRFLVRVSWEEGAGWRSRVCALSDLSWPETGLPYAVAPRPPWNLEFRRRWLGIASTDGVSRRDQAPLLEELAVRVGATSAAALIEADVPELVDFLLSLAENRLVASRQRNFVELVHTFLEPKRRRRLARLVKHVLAQTGNRGVLRHDTVSRKMVRCMGEAQDTRESVAGRTALELFPEWFER